MERRIDRWTGAFVKCVQYAHFAHFALLYSYNWRQAVWILLIFSVKHHIWQSGEEQYEDAPVRPFWAAIGATVLIRQVQLGDITLQPWVPLWVLTFYHCYSSQLYGGCREIETWTNEDTLGRSMGKTGSGDRVCVCTWKCNMWYGIRLTLQSSPGLEFIEQF